MKTVLAPNAEPDRYESAEWPTLVPDVPEETREAIDARSLGPTQARKIGSEPDDDATQGRKIGSGPYDDATQGQKIGHDLYDDATRGR